MFWSGLADIFVRFAPENRALLAVRDDLQARIDAWHTARRGSPHDSVAYQSFLREIGYLVDEPAPFGIETADVRRGAHHHGRAAAGGAGPERALPAQMRPTLAGAACSTHSMAQTPWLPAAPPRGAMTPPSELWSWPGPRPSWTMRFPGAGAHRRREGMVGRGWNAGPGPARSVLFAGYTGDPTAPSSVLLKHNGLHIELKLDRNHPVGARDPAGLADVVLEAALSTIVDFEDSIAAVDAEDKVAAYANWLGLMRGDLEASFDKGGRTLIQHPGPRPELHRPGRIGHDPAGALAVVRAQRRPPDDHAGGPFAGRERGARGDNWTRPSPA